MKKPEMKTVRERIDYALTCLDKEDKAQAQNIFIQLLDSPVEDNENLSLLANLATKLGEKVAAINLYVELVKNNPDNTGYMDSLAQAYIDNNMLLEAEQLLGRIIEHDPKFYLPYVRLSYIAIQNQSYSSAVELLETAVHIKPGESSIYINLVSALTHAGRQEEAYKYAKKLLRLEPKMAESYHMMGRILNELGQFDEAVSYFEKAIRINRTFGYSYSDLASAKKFSSDDADFIARAEKSLNYSMPPEHRIAIHFSLGKMYNDCGEWDRAFEHYQQGNLINRPAVLEKPYHEVFNKTHKFFNNRFFQKNTASGNDTECPVFVVGMPRSGTTLVEQIIASHPRAAGAGELNVIAEVNYAICPDEKNETFKKALTRVIEHGQLPEYARTYLDVLCKGREDALRIVDKMPNNFVFLGLIHLLFPNARIIHCIRSPLDVSLSCYFQQFRSIEWSFDLAWIVEQYRFYRKAMAYWKKNLPENTILDVEYEKLITNPELESRRLIEGIGLSWDSACLEFHNKKRTVNTASVWQVRQPVYTSSRRRWVNYAGHIGILANDLQEFLDDEDIAELEKRGVKLKKKWRLNPFA